MCMSRSQVGSSAVRGTNSSVSQFALDCKAVSIRHMGVQVAIEEVKPNVFGTSKGMIRE